MQIIKQNQLDEVLQSYLASNPTKPLLVWFEDNPTIDKYLKKYISKKGVGRTEGHPMWGHKQAVVNGEFVKLSEHPELLANDIYTDSVRNADWVLYHRYTEQLSREPLNYCINLQENLHKPVVCFVNAYSKAEQGAVDTSFIASNFCNELLVQGNYNLLIQNLSYYNTKSRSVAKSFGAPAIYFHQKALKWQQKNFLGDRHLEYIYATLTAWGMQRPGTRGATMSAFDDFKKSILAVKQPLLEWKDLRIETIDYLTFQEMLSDLTNVCFSIKATTSTKTRIVSCSKTLAHILPYLVCPIDKRYTLPFFDAHLGSIEDERKFFEEVMETMWNFYQNPQVLNAIPIPLLSTPFFESYPKIFDNLVIAYGR